MDTNTLLLKAKEFKNGSSVNKASGAKRASFVSVRWNSLAATKERGQEVHAEEILLRHRGPSTQTGRRRD